MLFNSFEFLIFFPAVTILYFLLPHKIRAFFLLIASCIFYMAFIPVYILILAVLVIVDYIAAQLIEPAEGEKRRWFLIVSLCANIGILAIFKYYNFLAGNINLLGGVFGLRCSIPLLKLILPIGLSFHTFQAMSYTIEVYRGRQRAEKNFIIYALYVMFYPQLVAGPIERPQHLIHQFREKHFFEYGRVTDGVKLMAWGLFKKVVIADRLAIVVNHVYAFPADHSGFQLTVATFFFAIQIYCDFSGYSDMAIGAAQIMGFNLMDNFNRPYFSKSVAEFWKRWHISLSTWFRDYVYIPLGGNRVSRRRWHYNIFLTFVLSGLWHGAQWTYVIWGALNGLYVICSHWKTRAQSRWLSAHGIQKLPGMRRYVGAGLTFLVVCFAWIFFRAKNIADAFIIISRLPTGWGDIRTPALLGSSLGGLGLSSIQLIIAIGSIVMLESVHAIQRHGSIRHMLSKKPAWARWTVYYALLFSVFFFGIFNNTQFIYFQF